MKNNINLNLIKKSIRLEGSKITEIEEYILDLLQERLYLLDERTEQEWIDAADPKGSEMKLLIESIKCFKTHFNLELDGKGFEGETYDLRD